MITPGFETTQLSSTDSVRIAALGAGLQGEYGAVTSIAREFGVSRPTVYAKAEQGRAALARAFEPQESGELHATVEVDEATLQRAIVSSYVEGPNSVRDTQALVMAFYGIHVGYGKVHAILSEASKRAAAFNRSVPLSGVRVAALDELFSQGDPVFAGLDLDTDYLFLLEHHDGRSGEDWAGALGQKKGQGLALETVVKDAGTGLAAGVTKAFPKAQQRDDTFHAIHRLKQVQQWLEKKGWVAMEQFLAAEEAYKHACEHEWPHYGASQKFRRARELFEAVVDRHDAFEKLMNKAIDAMEFAELATGALRTGSEQAARIKAIAARMAALGGKKVKTVARYLKNRAPGLALYIDELNAKLAGLSPRLSPELVRACCKLWRLGKEHCRAGSWKQRRIVRAAKSTVEAIVAMAPHEANDAFDEVHALIARRHRASSAVENFNALLRPYLHVHKRVSQSFLELFMAWRNLRTRPMGKHKGTSAYGLLTGETVDDWLTLLGYPPRERAN